ncbi:MAG: ParA family protein [Bacteroidetes bacterium]|nr:ParA family protein [Bacteroidota bacterium]
MSNIISVLGQKGGVGKSTLARVLAREFTMNEWDVLLADMNIEQATCLTWNQRRKKNEIEPQLVVEAFSVLPQAQKRLSSFDLTIFDGKPAASIETRDIAKISDLVLIPTKTGLDDLTPQLGLALELVDDPKANIDPNRIAFVLSRVSTDSAATRAREYLSKARYPFTIIDGYIQEKQSYENALNFGMTLTETDYDQLNERMNMVVQSIFNKFQQILSELTSKAV